jgi:putative FmdB family regulatory protein
MPNYDYVCKSCDEEFEYFHSMNGKLDKCIHCESDNVKKMFKNITFKVVDGHQSSANHGYTGRNQDLVNKLHGNKNYRDGFRNEIKKQESIGLGSYREEQKMAESQRIFEKMREEGMKMTKEEKEAIKQEHGIKKGMKPQRLVM